MFLLRLVARAEGLGVAAIIKGLKRGDQLGIGVVLTRQRDVLLVGEDVLHLLDVDSLDRGAVLDGDSGGDAGGALGGEIGLGLGLGGLLGGAGGGLHVDGNAGLAGSALGAFLRSALGLALGAGGLLGLVALGAVGLTLAVLLGGLGAVLVVSGLDNLGKSAENELDAADGVVVAGDHVVDRLGIGVGVDDGDDRDAQTDGFLDGVGFLDAVDDDDGAGLLGHIGDTRQILLELVELAAEHRSFLLVLGELAAVSLGGSLELTHALDGRTDRLGVGERTAEPALGDVELADARRAVLDEFGNLLLGGDEEDVLARENGVAEELGGFVEESDALGEVDDVDTVALVEDITFHLRVPTLRLVTEVETGVKHILERNTRKGGGRHFHLFIPFNP